MKSKITKISNRQKTVRTVIPKAVKELLNLKVGDYLEWTPVIEDNQVIFKVTKGEKE